MTLQEARKVIGLNIHNLNGSMQVAVATIMDALEEKAEIIGYLQPSEDLKEAADEYSRGLDYYHYTGDDPAIAFIAGAEWQKEQMLKDAVEVDVADLNGDIYNYCIEEGLTDEDKVKIVIIPDKEDEK